MIINYLLVLGVIIRSTFIINKEMKVSSIIEIIYLFLIFRVQEDVSIKR